MHLGSSRSRFALYRGSTPTKSSKSKQLSLMAKRTASFSQIKPITLNPQTKQQGTVIFLHGLGDTGFGWLQIMEMLHKKTPHIKYILPSAPSIPVTINGGEIMPAWYDIKDTTFLARSEHCQGLSTTQKTISDLIEEEIRNGIPSDNIMLGGFSQGGASAMYIGYTYPKKLAGLLLLSAYLPQQKEFFEKFNEVNRTTEFLMCHGDHDNVIPINWGRKASEQIKSLGVPGTILSYRDMAHEAAPEEIDDCLSFIQRIFGKISKL